MIFIYCYVVILSYIVIYCHNIPKAIITYYTQQSISNTIQNTTSTTQTADSNSNTTVIKDWGGTYRAYEAKHYIKTISNKIKIHAIMHSLECFEPTALHGIQI